MAADNTLPPTDVELLHSFLGTRINSGHRDDSVEQVLADFAEYRRQLTELRASLREAEAQSARGESKPLDVEDVIRRGRERLASKGITD
jgi:hypothetical protein